jgi:hypothetical protein
MIDINNRTLYVSLYIAMTNLLFRHLSHVKKLPIFMTNSHKIITCNNAHGTIRVETQMFYVNKYAS